MSSTGFSSALNVNARQLLQLARSFQLRHAEHAAGTCLSVSLQFAAEAQRRYGAQVRLTKWCVRGDPAYVDHWAVEWDALRVLDMTRVQVDGQQRLLGSVAGYPAHYVNRRSYPASLLLPDYLATGGSTAQRLSNRFIWRCGAALLRHDVAAAWSKRRPARAAAALREYARFLLCFGTCSLSRALEGRLVRLIGRLQRHADLPARTHLGGLD